MCVGLKHECPLKGRQFCSQIGPAVATDFVLLNPISFVLAGGGNIILYCHRLTNEASSELI